MTTIITRTVHIKEFTYIAYNKEAKKSMECYIAMATKAKDTVGYIRAIKKKTGDNVLDVIHVEEHDIRMYITEDEFLHIAKPLPVNKKDVSYLTDAQPDSNN